LERPFEAYRGDEPYVFICYAHDDQAVVYPELRWLHDSGINVWYDEGISPGEEWSEELGRAIENAERFVYFVSPRSVASRHCRNELSFAQNHDVPILSVHLEETALPSGVELAIGASQAMLKPELTESVYRERLLRALGGSAPAPPTQPAARPARAWWRWAIGTIVIVGGALAAWLLSERTHEPPAPDLSVAVIGVSALGDDPAVAIYADALTEELRTALAGNPYLRVVFAPGAAPPGVPDTSYALAGNAQRLDDVLRLRASLTRTANDRTVWSDTFDRPWVTVQADPAELAHTVSRFALAQLVLDSQCQNARRSSRSAEAAAALCAAYMEAVRRAQIGDGDPRVVLSNARRAVALDPEIPGAYALIANTYASGVPGLGWRETAREAHAALDRALALDPGNPALLMIRGPIQILELDYAGAEATYGRVLADPIYPDTAELHVELGILASTRGDIAAAVDHFDQALRINDAAANVHVFYAAALWIDGQHRDAIEIANSGLRLVDSGPFPFYLLMSKGLAHKALGEVKEARAAFEDAAASVGPTMRSAMAWALAELGRRDEARALLERLEAMDDPPLEHIVYGYAALRDPRAFEWIHRAIDHHVVSTVPFIRVNPVFSGLYDDPRWAEVIEHLDAEEAEARSRSEPNVPSQGTESMQ
jgi:tetratricopeptide (TPR) repeat protein/TolB-like protein